MHNYTNDAAVVAALASQAPSEIRPGKIYAARDEDGAVHVFNTMHYGDAPQRMCGTTTTDTMESFVQLFGDRQSAAINQDDHGDHVVWVSKRTQQFVGVLNATPGWNDHRIVFAPEPGCAWMEWLGKSGVWFSQADFADWLEDHLSDIAEPQGAILLEIAQSFRATTKAEFAQGEKIATGERTLRYSEEIEAKAGIRGQISIPETMTLALSPYEGGEKFVVRAAFRYRIREGRLLLGYKISDPQRTLDAAFEGFLAEMRAGIPQGVAVYFGTP